MSASKMIIAEQGKITKNREKADNTSTNLDMITYSLCDTCVMAIKGLSYT